MRPSLKHRWERYDRHGGIFATGNEIGYTFFKHLYFYREIIHENWSPGSEDQIISTYGVRLFGRTLKYEHKRWVKLKNVRRELGKNFCRPPAA